MSVCTGTLVPANNGAPLIRSGDIVISGSGSDIFDSESMPAIYHKPRLAANQRKPESLTRSPQQRGLNYPLLLKLGDLLIGVPQRLQILRLLLAQRRGDARISDFSLRCLRFRLDAYRNSRSRQHDNQLIHTKAADFTL